MKFNPADAPKIATSMRIAMHHLKLDAPYVMYPGPHCFSHTDGVEPGTSGL